MIIDNLLRQSARNTDIIRKWKEVFSCVSIAAVSNCVGGSAQVPTKNGKRQFVSSEIDPYPLPPSLPEKKIFIIYVKTIPRIFVLIQLENVRKEIEKISKTGASALLSHQKTSVIFIRLSWGVGCLHPQGPSVSRGPDITKKKTEGAWLPRKDTDNCICHVINLHDYY